MSGLGEKQFMERAIELAELGRGYVEPGVVVGCVVVRGGVILGEGYYERYGQGHAEVNALKMCRDKGVDVVGSDIYVTLEPCAHTGKTGPCAVALVEAQVGRVFVGMIDPFGEVSGRGVKILEDAGIKVEVGLCGEVCEGLNRGFLKKIEKGLPWVIGKWAQTVDGYTATDSGHSQWISNRVSRKGVHELRARVDVVMVGVGTAIADDARLTARGVEIKREALRVVVDPTLRIGLDAKLFETRVNGLVSPGVLLAVGQGADEGGKAEKLKKIGVEFFVLPELGQGVLDLASLMRYLSIEKQALHVLVEGGSRMMGRLFEQRLVDEVHVYVGAKLLADSGGMPAVVGDKKDKIGDGYAMSLLGVEAIAGDVLMRYLVD